MTSVTVTTRKGMPVNRPGPPLVSVVILVYNSEHYLRECLDSVMAQTYPNLEVLIMDDASTDNSPAIVTSYGERVKYYRQEKNRGSFGNMNDGIALANGEFIAVYHADDVYESEIVERGVAALRRFPDAGAVFCLDTFINISGFPYGKLTLPQEVSGGKPLDYPVIMNALLTYKNIFLVCPTCMVRSKTYREVGLYHDVAFRDASDLEMWLRIARNFPLVILEEYLHRYRHGHENVSKRYHHLRTTTESYFHVMDSYLAEGDIVLATSDALAAYEAHRAQDYLMIAVNHYIKDQLTEACAALDRISVRRLMGSVRIQRSRMLILYLAMRVLARLPRIRLLAELFYRRWHIKTYG